MRLIGLVLGLVAFVCACAHVPPENLSTLMGPPDQSGLLVIDCYMIEKDNKFLAVDDVLEVSLAGCSVVRKGGDGQPIQAKILVGQASFSNLHPVYFVFLKLEPGLYCIQSINGDLTRFIPATKEWPYPRSEDCQYTYNFPAWNVRDVILEVRAGIPTYFGEIVITEPYNEGASNKRSTTVKKIGKSEVVEIVASQDKEKKAWEQFLKKYPESLWASAMRARLEEIRGK